MEKVGFEEEEEEGTSKGSINMVGESE